MKTIIVATDFSPAALNATRYAADMALAIHANLFILHVYPLPLSYAEMPALVSSIETDQMVKNDMSALKKQLNAEKGDSLLIDTEVRMGSFFDELKTVCEQLDPYAVVMGCQGTTAAERFFFGSHAVLASKHLPWPVITVPPVATFSAVKKIGLACDLDNVAQTIPSDEIKMLVQDLNAELHILNYGKEKAFDADIVFESGWLQEMLKTLDPHYHFISDGNADDRILDFAEKNHIDLLLVLPKRHHLLDKLVHKSHTTQLVLHSHVPVMAVHPVQQHA